MTVTPASLTYRYCTEKESSKMASPSSSHRSTKRRAATSILTLPAMLLSCYILCAPHVIGFAPSGLLRHRGLPLSTPSSSSPSSLLRKEQTRFHGRIRQKYKKHNSYAASTWRRQVTVDDASSLDAGSSAESSSSSPTHPEGRKPPFSVTLEEEDYSYKEAVVRTLGWVGASILFGSILWALAGPTTGEEFFAGYLVEQSLSVDNLFVFLLLFEYFKVPLQYQDRVLNWGIYGAILMRGLMIGLGAAALQRFHAILLVFAGILIYSSVQFFVGGGDEQDDEGDPSHNSIIKFSHSLIDSTEKFDGKRFFTIEDGIRKATPLFICMIAVEISDVVFAVDSIPAVFGVTEVRS